MNSRDINLPAVSLARRRRARRSRSLLPGVQAPAAIGRRSTRARRSSPTSSPPISAINADGSAIGWFGKIDMGQGTDIGDRPDGRRGARPAGRRVSMVQGDTDTSRQ